MRKVAPVAMPRGTISFWCGQVYSSRGGQFLGSAEEKDLIERFDGLTAFIRSPAEGRWQKGLHEASDDIVILEVLTPTLDVAWWREYRTTLESTFAPEKILVLAQEATIL